MKLNQLQEGKCAKVTAVCVDGAMRRRLVDFGLIEETEIRCLRRGRHYGPSLYFVRGTMLALRNHDSGKICVEPCE